MYSCFRFGNKGHNLSMEPRQTVSEGEKMNLVVCGSDGPLKSSISERILQQTDGRSVVELPALFNPRLSEEEVMRQTLRCVSLCHPGVHVFLFIIPDAPLNNEDKAEMEEIQRIFSSRIKKHMLILIMQSSERQTADLSEETQAVIESFGGRHHVFGPTAQVSTLMENIEQMLEENRQEFFSTETFFDVQMKKLLQYEEKKKKIHPLETDSAESEDDLRIVLLGKTGVGKSATGNTILGRDAFKAELSHQSITKETQRETARTNGRHIAVIDTPGLFDTELTNEEIQREISNCISMILPGPHVFIIVLNLGQRFTQEEATSVKIIQETFGQNSFMFTMVLFTRGDCLNNKTIEEFIGKPGSAIRNLIEACGNRYHVFNNQTGDRAQVSDLLEKIDAMVKANGGSFYSCKRFRQMEREKQEQQMKSLMERVEQLNREREELMKKLEEEKERMKAIMEEERLNHDKERKRTEEEDKYIREREKYISDEQIQRLKSEMEGIIREKERIERERQEQLEDLEKRLKEERNTRGAQQTTFNENLKFIEKQHEEEQRHSEEKMQYYERYEDELKRIRVQWREECEREKENVIKKFYTETDDSLQNKAYRKLETEYSKWSWRLRIAMMETENKLHNKIENEAIHEVKETDLQRELKTTCEEVQKSMTEYLEKDKYKDILIKWKTSLEIKIKELQENIVRETKRKLNEVLQQRDLKKMIDAQRTHHENTLYEKSKRLALQLKDKANDEKTLKKEFDLFWEHSVNIRDTPPIKDIDIMRDAREILNDIYEGLFPVDHWKESRDIFTVTNYSDYVKIKKSSGFTVALTYANKSAKEMIGCTLSKEDEAQIRSLITDVAQQTDTMIQSFTISKMGYNKSSIQQLIGYIKVRVMQHEEGFVQYEFKNEFFMDLVNSICKRATKTITDQHNMFKEANDPVLYSEKKREEYYSIFQKYCNGATSAAIFGEIICQKLKEPIEQSLLKKTARDLTDEMRSNCQSLNGNRSNLEKHILKTLAEEEDFDKYMNYIHNPRDHYESFIREEVSRYITQFSVSVLFKMKNMKFLQQKIMDAAHESTEHVQVNRGDVGLWLKSFTQRLSDVLIFSEKDLRGVKHDDVDDFNLLEDVIRQELPAVMSDICSRFNTKTFPVKLDNTFRPDKLLIDHFCQCCWVQCPFCGATCTNTIENHPGDHSAPFHRVRGTDGTCYELTQTLCTDTCTDLLKSDQHFNASGGRFPYKGYRRAGGIYAKWSINSTDLFDQMYWKWFVCRFQKDLGKYYNKTFEGRGKIPDKWKKYSKQEAIESLDFDLQWIGEKRCTIL